MRKFGHVESRVRHLEASVVHGIPMKDIREQLSHYKGIKPQNLGKFLGQGNEHYVFRYKGFEATEGDPTDGWVLKIPKLSAPSRPGKVWQTPEEVTKGYELLRKYFGDSAIPETHVLPSTTSDRDYCMVQKEIPHAKHLTVNMLIENPALREQFYHIIWANFQLDQDKPGQYLPLLGREGTISTLKGKPLLTNVVVEGEGENAKLRIVDFGMLNNNPLAHDVPPKTKPSHPELEAWIRDIDTHIGQPLANHLPPQMRKLLEREEVSFKHLEQFLKQHAQDPERYVAAAMDGACIVANEVVIELFFLRLLDKHMQSKAADRRRIWNRWNPWK